MNGQVAVVVSVSVLLPSSMDEPSPIAVGSAIVLDAFSAAGVQVTGVRANVVPEPTP